MRPFDHPDLAAELHVKSIDNDITFTSHHQNVFTYLARFEAPTSRPATDRSMDVQQLQEILRFNHQITANSRTTEERGGKDNAFRL
jgi:hypothetical protein